MTTLADIKQQLLDNKQVSEDTTAAVLELRNTLVSNFNLEQAQRAADRLEDLERQRELIAQLQSGGAPSPGPGGAPPTPGASIDLSKMGLLAGGLVASVATTIGVIKGQLTAIQTYFKVFTPGLVTTLDNFKNSLIARFTSIIDDLKIRTAFIKVAITTTFDNFVNNIKTLFSVDPNSNFARVINTIKSSLTAFVEPFKQAVTVLTDLTSPTGSPGVISRAFDAIKTLLSNVGNTLGRLVGIVGKLFAPIAIIMTAFDTVKGALDGYAEAGILGALQGAIDGLFTSLITKPLDLLKSAVAWVLKKLGFDETSEVLQSFSFTKLFEDMTDAVFNFIRGTISWVKTTYSDAKRYIITKKQEIIDPIFNGIANLVSFVGDNFTLMKDIIAASFDYELTRIVNGFKKAFEEVATFIANIPDQLYLLISENLRFGMPTIEFPLPEWMQKWPINAPPRFTLLEGFEAGVGDATTQAAARSRIAERSAARDTTIQTLDRETASKLDELRSMQMELGRNFQQVVINQVAAPAQGGSGGGAYLLPAAPVIDTLDAVSIGVR